MELVLEQTQQGSGHEVSVSIEEVEDLKRKVKIKGEKKEALLTPRQKSEVLWEKDSSWDTARLPILRILCGIVHSANLDFASLIWNKFEWQSVERSSRPSNMSKLLYNKSIPRRSSSKLHSSQDDQPITKLSNTVKGDYMFGMEIPDTMIMNVPNKLKKYVVPRETRSLTIAEETVVGELAHSISIQEPRTQPRQRSQLTIDKKSDKAVADMYNERKIKCCSQQYYDSFDFDSDATLYSSSSDKTEESANETDDADESEMDLSNDNPDGDDDVAGYGVFMHNKSTTTPNSTYLSLTITTFKKTVQAKVLTKMKKLLPTHIPKAVANYVMPRLNTYVHEVMKNNQINLFTQSSTSTDDLLEMDLKLKLLNQIHESKPNMTHATNQKLYDTLYESICLDHDALNAQDTELSFHMMSCDNQVTSNNREGENKKKRRKDVGEPSSRSSWKNKYPMKSGSDNAKRITTCFNLLLKSDIDQNKNHILGPSTVAIAKKIKAIIQKDELTIANLEGARLERLKQQYQNDVELEYHVDQLKAVVLTEAK
ncbi:hypothetical protein Tco_0529934 [Tanacetum coccineum]